VITPKGKIVWVKISPGKEWAIIEYQHGGLYHAEATIGRNFLKVSGEDQAKTTSILVEAIKCLI